MAGGLVHVLVYPESLVPVIGASGAVSGLVGASLRFILRGGGNLEDAPLMPLFAPKLMAAVLVWSVLNFVLGTIGFSPEGFGALIAWEAHMGGFLVGLLLLPFLDRPSPAPR
jgi:membrane associated rhomboid family serine protease